MGTRLEDIEAITSEVSLALADDQLTDTLLDQLSDATENLDQLDEDVVTQTAARIESLLRLARQHETATGLRAQGALRLLLVQTKRILNTRSVEASRLEREQQGVVVADRLLQVLELRQPARTRDLAEDLGLHPSQISRALRHLEESRQIHQVTGPGNDGRARWYALTSPAQPGANTLSTPSLTATSKRKRLRNVVPFSEMQKRGWLPDTDDLDQIEVAVCDLLGIPNLEQAPMFAVAARRANRDEALTPSQTAWIAYVRRQALAIPTNSYSPDATAELAASLVRRIRTPLDLTDLTGWLAGAGIALVVEEPLKSSKLDGIVLLEGENSPVIGLTTRGDRLDGVIFTLLHEMAHLVLEHVKPGEVTVDEDLKTDDPTNIEHEANELAARWILPHGLEGLDLATGTPSLAAITEFAHTEQILPCFVIGRLQTEQVLDWKQHRPSIPKARQYLLPL